MMKNIFLVLYIFLHHSRSLLSNTKPRNDVKGKDGTPIEGN